MVILDIIILLVTITGISFIIKSIVNRSTKSKLLKERDKAMAKQEIASALSSNSRKGLENALILNGHHLNNEQKEAIKVRIAELTIQEDLYDTDLIEKQETL